jgi:hypothetical protein
LAGGLIINLYQVSWPTSQNELLVGLPNPDDQQIISNLMDIEHNSNVDSMYGPTPGESQSPKQGFLMGII